MEESKEIRFTNKEKAIMGFALASGIVIGCVVGSKYNTYRISKGLGDLWKANPGLQEIMYVALKQPSTWVMNLESECE